jgi:hypothetical protein
MYAYPFSRNRMNHEEDIDLFFGQFCKESRETPEIFSKIFLVLIFKLESSKRRKQILLVELGYDTCL